MWSITSRIGRTGRQNGLTLLELVFSLTLVVFLVFSIFLVYIVTLRGWDQIGHRTDLDEKLHFALERIVRDVREANDLVVADHAVRITERGTNNSYIYYLHNASDSWVPNYAQDTYDLRREALTAAGGAGIGDDTFAYGNGDVIVTGLTPPSSGTNLTSSGNYAILKLVGKQEDDTMTVRGYVRPRNV
jgi:Tfp pilus assembly protein PilW